ncbi:hypothetical protein QUF49_11835 [Fictibacillus sp. b24]|uniref:hypothetical protein n=1 Tax=Fictibacillus sp. b24 TaxID=3055863 RepID=UPI0025A0FD67|nr:hypothetical protein [Fictibacillus sp. b24]MDM5316688.1 hypothetical protein [Fictibacillus sp. b24]
MNQQVILIYTEARTQIMIGNGKRIISWIFYGTVAGILLACFFYITELFFKIKLYTFLLNIDFLPLPDYIIFNEPLQFVLHIFIAIALIACVDLICVVFNHPYLLSLFINIIMSLTFFPLYYIAVSKPFQPPLTMPFFLWLIGHILFAILIGFFVNQMHKKNTADA